MRVLCIDTVSSFIAPMALVTIGRWYDVIDDNPFHRIPYYFWICDDNGYVTASIHSNFKSLDQVREERLCEIFGGN